VFYHTNIKKQGKMNFVMVWCFKCGVSEDKALLYDAIGEKGIVKVCRQCSLEEDIPIIRKPSEKPAEKPILPKNVPKRMSEQSQRMYGRLARLSGIKFRERRSEEEMALIQKQEKSLKDIANKNFEEKLRKGPGDRSELTENFHWLVMRARRAKHLTPEQLAKAVGESESAIKRLEQGIVPNDPFFIKKIENYLKIRISKNIPETTTGSMFLQKSAGVAEGGETKLSFDPLVAQDIKISDLLEIKREKEAKQSWFGRLFKGESKKSNREKTSEKGVELSDEDIDDILFRK
jgi:ribosome-binding protein aMBF1 (putative translation factor)